MVACESYFVDSSKVIASFILFLIHILWINSLGCFRAIVKPNLSLPKAKMNHFKTKMSQKRNKEL